MWDDGLLRITPTLAAVSTLLLVFISGIILATERLQRRRRPQ
jgi:putative spermidine/putrescine transport system permease protein